MFTAILLPPDLIEVVASVKILNRSVANVKWVPSQNYHITQYFIGHVYPASIPEIINVSEKVLGDSDKFRIYPAQFSVEGVRKKPSMIWLRFRQEKIFSALHNALHEALEPITKLDKKFSDPIPHVTVARLRKSNAKDEFILPDIPASVKELAVTAHELWQSDSTESGVQYKCLHKFDASV